MNDCSVAMKQSAVSSKNRAFAAVALAVACCLGGNRLFADENRVFDIQSDLAGPALLKLAAAANVRISISEEDGRAVRLPALQGEYSLKQALDTLLAGSDLSYEFTSPDSLVIKAKNSTGSRSVERYRNSELEEILVTAQKREQSLKDVPISIVALGASELENRGIDSLENLGMAVPGVAVFDGGIQRSVAIRGVNNVNGATPLTGFYIDEMPVLGGESGFQVDLPDLRIYDLERVEVLRGPQGTLYGQGSMGGTIRYITKDPELDRFGVKADISASVTSDGAPSEKIQGVLNIPLIEDELGLRIATTFENAGGWVDQPDASQQDVNDFNVAHVRIKGLWRPVEDFEVSTMVTVHRNDAGAPKRGEDQDGNLSVPFIPTITPTLSDDYELYNLTLKKDFDGFLVLSSTNFTEKNTLATHSFELFEPASYDTLYEDFIVTAEIFNQEIRLSSNGDGALKWTLGGTYKDLSSTFSGGGVADVRGTPFESAAVFQFTRNTSSEAWAVFGNASYALSELLEVGAGVRYFEDERTFSDLGGDILQDTFDSVNPRVYINYHIADNVMVYTSVAKGFRSGGFNTLNQPSYEPESLWTYELGSKISLADGMVDAEIALFYTEYSDFLVRGILPPPAPKFSIFANAGDVEITGVDWALTFHATDNLSLAFDGNYVDAEVVSVAASSSSHIVGDPVDGIPEYSFTLSAKYLFDWDDKPGFVRVDYSKRDKVNLTNRSFGLIGQSDIVNMLNASIGWQWRDNLSLGLYASNLLDERVLLDTYEVFGVGSRSRPRTIGFKIGVDF